MVISARKILVAFLVLVLCVGTIIYASSTIEANSRENQLYIVIDAGHGGEDGGASAPDGTKEKDINLEIAIKLFKTFEKNGYKVILTRDSDKSTCGGEKFNKNADMHERIALANKFDNAVYISIHMNKFSDSKYSGAQVFYSGKDTMGEKLANSIQTSIVTKLQNDNNRLAKDGGGSLYLRKIRCACVIVECGFLSNEKELEMLKNAEYQQKMADCIFDGAKNYLENKSKE